jgi:carbamoyltransferase
MHKDRHGTAVDVGGARSITNSSVTPRTLGPLQRLLTVTRLHGLKIFARLGLLESQPQDECQKKHDKTYVGLSCSPTHDTLSIIDSRGAIVFAEENERRPPRASHRGQIPQLSDSLDRYCEPDSDIVIALPLKPFSIRDLRKNPSDDGLSTDSDSLLQLHAMPLTRSDSRLREFSPLARLANGVENHLRERRQNRGVVRRRYYSRDLAQAAAACLIGPYGEALCAIVDDSVEDWRCYLYRDRMFFQINPIGASAHKFAADIAPNAYNQVSGSVQSDASTATDTALCALSEISEDFGFTRQTDASDSAVPYIACTAQTDFERRLCAFVRNLHVLVRSENLILTGGRALNALANGKILRETGFKSMYVPCTPCTSGDAAGAALLAHCEDNPGSHVDRRSTVQNPYLGSTISSRELSDKILETGLYELRTCNGCACTEAATLVSRGSIVAWVQGRAEFCPQSLGNRSILADPRRVDLRDHLGSLRSEGEDIALPRVSVLHEYGPECVDDYQVSPYMERALRLRPKFLRRVPGLIGTDGIVRVHTVRMDWNERFYNLIFCFYRLTGIPMIVNLDCRLPGRGFVRTDEDILSILSTKRVDALFFDELMVSRRHCDISAGQQPPVGNRQEQEVVQ